MSREQNIIELAEWLGWERLERVAGEHDRWFNDFPGHRMEECRAIEHLPNPYESHEDCHAVIRKLNSEGYSASVDFHTDGTAGVVVLFGPGSWSAEQADWSGDDYRIGVCELAIKIICISVEVTP